MINVLVSAYRAQMRYTEKKYLQAKEMLDRDNPMRRKILKITLDNRPKPSDEIEAKALRIQAEYDMDSVCRMVISGYENKLPFWKGFWSEIKKEVGRRVACMNWVRDQQFG